MRLTRRTFPLSALALASAATAHAQDDISWLTLVEESSRIPAGPLVASDTMEKDYDWADLDQDGWTDVVVARKVGWTGGGPAPNVLLMNEGGTLVDRTALYASASDVPGDQGFLTSTNDRDIEIVDVDGDGWLDVVTCTAISNGLPKHLSHPRVYMNLGENGAGDWLGLEYQDARFPDLGDVPFFCGVGSGDVDGDGSPDLYFVHYVAGGAVDIDDKLMLNDGNGFYTDESLSRMTVAMLSSGFGTSAYIVDMNGDGANDVLRNFSSSTTIAYNDPGNEGFFNILDEVYPGASYHTNHGDLNQDGLPDLLQSDDGDDRYQLNQGNDALGRVIWSASHTFNADQGFAGNNLIVDLDADGWNDAIITDCDVDVPGCSRRMFIYHNRGGTVGGFVTLFEESGGGMTSATGMTAFDLEGTHDVAVFDLDNDGDNDILQGRCNTTHCWINQTDTGPPPTGITLECDALPHHQGGVATLADSSLGATSSSGLHLECTDGPAGEFGFFLVSGSSTPGVNVFLGILCMGSPAARYNGNVATNQGNPALNSIGQFDGSGVLVNLAGNSASGTGFDVPAELPFAPAGQLIEAGSTWYFQCWYRDLAVGVPSANFSNVARVQF